MISPPTIEREQERIKELESFSILDTLPEKDYDDITALAAQICGTPISLISIIDEKRQWFKSHHGLDATETPREFAFCAHAINDSDNAFVVHDARKDERFSDNPLVTAYPNVIFYAGIPLVSSEGLALGSLCVIDHEPRELSTQQLNALKALANQTINLLRLRKANYLLEQSMTKLEEKNEELERFACIAAHDLKSPLVGISSMVKLLAATHGKQLGADAIEMFTIITQSCNKLKSLIEGLLDHSKNELITRDKNTFIDVENLKKEIISLFAYENGLQIFFKSELAEIFANKTALDQILINLISNAIKYNDKPTVAIEISISEQSKNYLFYIKDNGPGIAPEYQVHCL